MKKIFECIKKNKTYLIYVLFLIIILINHLYSYNHKTNNIDTVKHYNIGNFYEKVEENKILYYDEIITQKFISQKNNLYKVKILFNGIENSNSKKFNYAAAYLTVSIEDENHNTLEKHKYDKIFLEDKEFFVFEFETIENSKDRVFYIKIEAYHPVTLFVLPIQISNDDNYELLINNNLINGNLLLETSYKKNSNLYIILTTIITIIFITIIFIFSKINLTSEKKYLILSITISILMILLTPPYAGHDEISHWSRVYEIEKGNIITDESNGWLYTSIPQNTLTYKKYSDLKTLLANNIEGEMEIEMTYSSVYSPISYIPQIIGLKVAKVFFQNSFYWTYIVRIFESIFCIICTYYAIKIIPHSKNIIFFICLLPTYIQATSYISADACLVASSILFISKILQITSQKDEIRIKDYILLFILSCILALSKLVYIPLCFMLLYVIYNRKDCKKQIIFILILTMIITGIWNLIAMSNLMSGQGGNAAYYIKEILINPIHFIQITLYSFINQIGNHINDLFGGMNSWYLNTISDSTIFPLFFFIIYIYLLNDDKKELKNKEKIYLILIVIMTYLLISTSLYISCTPVHNNQIIGIQGRYLLPLLLPIYLLVPKGKIKKDISIILTFIYLAYFLKFIIIYL